MNARNRTLVKPLNPRRHFPMADDKLRTKEVLEEAGVPVPRTLHVFTNLLEASRAPSLLAATSNFVVKPATGRAGAGILVLVERAPGGWFDHAGKLWSEGEVSRWIANILFGNYSHGLSDRAFVEERLVQAPLLGRALLLGLPDIRIITVRGEPLMAMLRLPTSRSHGKANLHQGAIGVGVDLQSGRTTQASFRGATVEHHPDTGVPLLGQVIPHWPCVLDVSRRAASVLPLGYLGIDVALDAHRGPLVLEVNVRPGLEIQNANGHGLRAALAALGQEGESRAATPWTRRSSA